MKAHLKYWFALICVLCTFAGFVSMPGMAFAATSPGHSTNGKPTPSASPQSIVCNAQWHYDKVSVIGYPQHQVGPTYRDYNGTGSTATVKLTSTVSGTVSLSVNASVTVDANVVIGSVKATTGITVTASLTATTGNEIDISVPAHKAGYGAYGVYQVETSGHYYYEQSNCTIGEDDGSITTWSPWYVGWNTWIGN